MRDSIFLDTNILVYLFSEDEPGKTEIASDVIAQGFVSLESIISMN